MPRDASSFSLGVWADGREERRERQGSVHRDAVEADSGNGSEREGRGRKEAGREGGREEEGGGGGRREGRASECGRWGAAGKETQT